MGDPRCPRCGRKVGATATGCLHCGAAFEAPHGGDAPNRGIDPPAARDADRPSWLDRQLVAGRNLRDCTLVAIGLVTLIAHAGPVVLRAMVAGGSPLPAPGAGLAVPMLIGVESLAVGLWLHHQLAGDPGAED